MKQLIDSKLSRTLHREIKMPGGVDASTFKQSVKDIRPEKIEEELFG